MTPAAAANSGWYHRYLQWRGRIAWSTISDYLGRAQTYILFFYYRNRRILSTCPNQ